METQCTHAYRDSKDNRAHSLAVLLCTHFGNSCRPVSDKRQHSQGTMLHGIVFHVGMCGIKKYPISDDNIGLLSEKYRVTGIPQYFRNVLGCRQLL